MTTDTYNTVIAHTSDAEFRAWGLALHNSIMSHGTIANAADTGQIDFTTVIRPAINVAGGYKIYYLNDPLHATVPVYIKVEYGTGTTATFPQVWVTIGIGTNGAGTLNPTLISPRVTVLRSTALLSTVINYPTFTCSINGYLGVCFKRGAAANQGYGGFYVTRSCDALGAISADGVNMYTCPSGANPYISNQLRFSPALARTPTGGSYCMVADQLNADTSTAFGLNVQSYKWYAAWPRMRCNPFLLTAYLTDIPLDTTFTDIPVGSTAHTYRQMGVGFEYGTGITATGQPPVCVLWE